MKIHHSVTLSFIIATAWSSSSFAMDFATNSIHVLESAYVEDCKNDPSPHGYYGAFLQPCEFTFRQVDESKIILQSDDMCSDHVSTVVSKPVPMNWFFNLTDHFDKNDWDEISSDDFEDIADKLMLWPDQCVGATPRCYNVHDTAVRGILEKLFDDIPEGSTHVQVSCQSDALELSRLAYSFADGFEKSAPTILAWMTTVLLFSLVASLWCCYACFRLCRRGSTPVAVATPVTSDAHYVSIENGQIHEKEQLLKE